VNYVLLSNKAEFAVFFSHSRVFAVSRLLVLLGKGFYYSLFSIRLFDFLGLSSWRLLFFSEFNVVYCEVIKHCWDDYEYEAVDFECFFEV
jgi:hypothetical protein